MNPLSLLPGVSAIRIASAIAVAVALAASHYKAYHVGGSEARAEHAEYVKDLAVTASKASESNRTKEKTLNQTVGRLRDALAKEKTSRAAADAANADQLRSLQTALGDTTRPDSPAACGAHDDPRDCIIAQCTGALSLMDSAVARLSSQTSALQSYASSVCVSPEK